MGATAVKRVILENESLRATLLPELGGKLVSLLGLHDGREHLLQPPEFPWRPAEYGASFESYDTSGWDECFPTVGSCLLPGGRLCPDHGELWPVPWEEGERSATSLSLSTQGRAFSYHFRRRVSLHETRAIFDYQVENTGATDFPYLWSAHPLLQVAPGDRIVLPPEVESVAVEWSAGERISGRVPWQVPAELGPAERGWADKLFAGPLREGWCRIDYSRGGSLTFRFPSESVPYLGLWICQGGWPATPARAHHYTVALEPCTAPCDRLDTAMERGYARRLRPQERASWSITLEVDPGRQ